MFFDYLIIVISLKLAEKANVEVWQKMKKSNFQISNRSEKFFSQIWNKISEVLELTIPPSRLKLWNWRGGYLANFQIRAAPAAGFFDRYKKNWFNRWIFPLLWIFKINERGSRIAPCHFEQHYIVLKLKYTEDFRKITFHL